MHRSSLHSPVPAFANRFSLRNRRRGADSYEFKSSVPRLIYQVRSRDVPEDENCHIPRNPTLQGILAALARLPLVHQCRSPPRLARWWIRNLGWNRHRSTLPATLGPSFGNGPQFFPAGASLAKFQTKTRPSYFGWCLLTQRPPVRSRVKVVEIHVVLSIALRIMDDAPFLPRRVTSI